MVELRKDVLTPLHCGECAHAHVALWIDSYFRYEANGSVYFMTNKFNQDERHFYAKLVPEAFGDSAALAEGEGEWWVGHVNNIPQCNFSL